MVLITRHHKNFLFKRRLVKLSLRSGLRSHSFKAFRYKIFEIIIRTMDKIMKYRKVFRGIIFNINKNK